MRPRRHPTAAQVTLAVDSSVQVSGILLLVVDDEPDARTVLRQLFEERGAVVSTGVVCS